MAGVPEQDAAAWSGDVTRFSAYLEDTGQAFLFRGEANGQQAHVRFTGLYRGSEVVWDCSFTTLTFELQQTASRSPELNHNFIDIGEPVECGIPLRVCLNLGRIDLPAVRKMIIMIRNYKRLQQGRHAFGDHSFIP